MYRIECYISINIHFYIHFYIFAKKDLKNIHKTFNSDWVMTGQQDCNYHFPLFIDLHFLKLLKLLYILFIGRKNYINVNFWKRKTRRVTNMRSDTNGAKKKMLFFPFPVVQATECNSTLLVPPDGTQWRQKTPVTTTTWHSLLHSVIHLLITSHGPDTVLGKAT